MQQRIGLYRLLHIAAVLTVAFSVLTGLDIAHRNVELFCHFRLQYFGASLVLLTVFVLCRKTIPAIILLATAIFNASFLMPWYLPVEAPSGRTELTLLHANVHASNTDYRRTVEYLLEEDADIVFLQEITPEWLEGLSALHERYPHVYSASRHGNFGIAMYSKLALASVRHIDSPPLGYPSIIATTAGEPAITLISSHPTIPLGTFGYAARNEQLKSVRELIAGAAVPVVLIGDLNASIWDPHFREIERVTGLRSTRYGFGVLPSWPTYLPFAMIPIDHVLISEGLAVVETRTGRRIGSDHLPLLVTLSL